MFLQINNLEKFYGEKDNRVQVLKGLSTGIGKGEICVLLGPSGSGKSTLLNIIGGIESYDKGEIIINGAAMSAMNEKQMTLYRREHLGYVFQFYNLIPSLTAYENIALVKSIVKDMRKPDELLEMVGLSSCRNKFPSQMSGGEQQRVSIARALAKNPKILLGDEPTGALDSETGAIVLELLVDLCKSEKKTVILVTHNAEIAKCADKVIRMKNGKIREIYENAHPCSVREVEW